MMPQKKRIKETSKKFNKNTFAEKKNRKKIQMAKLKRFKKGKEFIQKKIRVANMYQN